MIIFIVGACGAGKTTLCRHLAATLPAEEYLFYYSDDSPIPSNEEVEKMHGGWDGWQRQSTTKWVNRLVQLPADKVIIWDGQARLNYIEEAMAVHERTDYQILVMECKVEEMNRRLIEERKQPHLATEQQANWRAHLHRQAEEMDVAILDTTNKAVEVVATEFRERLL